MDRFKEWCAEYELTSDTIKLLADKGFDSYKKYSHDKLSMAQYMEGAMRILHARMTEDGIGIETAADYVNYIIQVGVFAQSFQWQSVLHYDNVYQNKQQALGFKWGTGSAFLMTSHLQKPVIPAADGGNNKKTSTLAVPKDPKSGKSVCLSFNDSNGCQRAACKFVHVCRSCFGDHPEVQHKVDKSTPKNC